MEPTPTPTPTATSATTPVPATPTPDPAPLDPPTKPAKKVNILPILLVSLAVLLLAAGGYFYYQNSLLQKQLSEMKTAATPTPTPMTSTSPSPTSASPSPTAIPGNLETYTDPTYKFEITFPKKYKIQSDNYGWPKAVLILYAGGQSYDLVIETWDTKAEYEAKYQGMMDAITVVQSQSTKKYFTLNNANKDPEVTQIISTFKVD